MMGLRLSTSRKDGIAPLRHAPLVTARSGIGIVLTAGIALFLQGLVGCAGTKEAVPLSGFLGDYSTLQAGQEGQARLIYFNPDADLADFHSAIVDAVEIYGYAGFQALLDASARQKADYFNTALRKQLGRGFRLTDRPGPGVLRIRMAITESSASSITVECEVLDSNTGTRLVAAVDEQEQDDAATPADDARSFAQRSFDRWAQALGTRLAAMRDFDRSQNRRDALERGEKL